MAQPAIKRMDIAEFRAEGWVQEINRLFLHPAGLALEVEVDDDDGTERLGGIWDYRDDREGIYYEDGVIDPAKAERVRAAVGRKMADRIVLLGYTVQPVP